MSISPKDDCIIVEGNPGMGLLTKSILDRGAKRIRVFENRAVFVYRLQVRAVHLSGRLIDWLWSVAVRLFHRSIDCSIDWLIDWLVAVADLLFNLALSVDFWWTYQCFPAFESLDSATRIWSREIGDHMPVQHLRLPEKIGEKERQGCSGPLEHRHDTARCTSPRDASRAIDPGQSHGSAQSGSTLRRSDQPRPGPCWLVTRNTGDEICRCCPATDWTALSAETHQQCRQEKRLL